MSLPKDIETPEGKATLEFQLFLREQAIQKIDAGRRAALEGNDLSAQARLSEAISFLGLSEHLYPTLIRFFAEHPLVPTVVSFPEAPVIPSHTQTHEEIAPSPALEEEPLAVTSENQPPRRLTIEEARRLPIVEARKMSKARGISPIREAIAYQISKKVRTRDLAREYVSEVLSTAETDDKRHKLLVSGEVTINIAKRNMRELLEDPNGRTTLAARDLLAWAKESGIASNFDELLALFQPNQSHRRSIATRALEKGDKVTLSTEISTSSFDTATLGLLPNEEEIPAETESDLQNTDSGDGDVTTLLEGVISTTQTLSKGPASATSESSPRAAAPERRKYTIDLDETGYNILSALLRLDETGRRRFENSTALLKYLVAELEISGATPKEIEEFKSTLPQNLETVKQALTRVMYSINSPDESKVNPEFLDAVKTARARKGVRHLNETQFLDYFSIESDTALQSTEGNVVLDLTKTQFTILEAIYNRLPTGKMRFNTSQEIFGYIYGARIQSARPSEIERFREEFERELEEVVSIVTKSLDHWTSPSSNGTVHVSRRISEFFGNLRKMPFYKGASPKEFYDLLSR